MMDTVYQTRDAGLKQMLKVFGSMSEPKMVTPLLDLFIDKLLEKDKKNQLANYLSVNLLVSPSQSAYLKYHSTQTAHNHMADHCLSNINKGYINLV